MLQCSTLEALQQACSGNAGVRVGQSLTTGPSKTLEVGPLLDSSREVTPSDNNEVNNESKSRGFLNNFLLMNNNIDENVYTLDLTLKSPPPPRRARGRGKSAPRSFVLEACNMQ